MVPYIGMGTVHSILNNGFKNNVFFFRNNFRVDNTVVQSLEENLALAIGCIII